MMRIRTIAARELPADLLSPAGYVITALFLLITGFLFAFAGFEQGQTASLRPTFDVITWVLLFICPAVAMRTITSVGGIVRELHRDTPSLEQLFMRMIDDAGLAATHSPRGNGS